VSIKQDRDADGLVDHVCRYNIPVGTNTSRTECDFNNDGVVDSSELVVKRNGRIVEIRHDDGDDGVADWATLYEYDAAGNVILNGTDVDLDGAVDDWEEYDYSDGLLMQTRGYMDRVLEYTVYDEYDERGRRTRRHYDNVVLQRRHFDVCDRVRLARGRKILSPKLRPQDSRTSC